jgi:hypothetical protein
LIVAGQPKAHDREEGPRIEAEAVASSVFGRSLTAHSYQAENGEGPSREFVAVHSSILDNNHISLRVGPIEAGGLWEHIKYREESEWKGGVRLAARIRRVKFIFQCLGPSVEYRGGLAFEK